MRLCWLHDQGHLPVLSLEAKIVHTWLLIARQLAHCRTVKHAYLCSILCACIVVWHFSLLLTFGGYNTLHACLCSVVQQHC